MEKNILESLENLNMDYLKILNNPITRKTVFPEDNHGNVYKMIKMWEILSCLGLDILFRYLCKHDIDANKAKCVNSISVSNKKNRIAVYTAIFGEIDNLIEPLVKPPEVDYYVITDCNVKKNSLWKKIDVSNYSFPKNITNQLKNRYCKLFPDEFISGYDYSIYVDGNILVVSDLSKLVKNIGDYSIGIFTHPSRDDLYVEAAAVIYLNNATGKEVKKQILAYKNEGFPKNYGLFENSLIVRRQNDNEVKKIMMDWWIQLNTYTKRDQLSFMYVLWKNGFDKSFVFSLGDNIDLCPLIRRVRHIRK